MTIILCSAFDCIYNTDNNESSRCSAKAIVLEHHMIPHNICETYTETPRTIKDLLTQSHLAKKATKIIKEEAK